MKIGYMLNPITHPKVYIDGAKLISDVYPKVENKRTLVPLRAIMENCGAEVSWDQEKFTASIEADKVKLTIRPGDNILYKNGKEIEIDVPAKVENERILIPLRAIMEAFNYEVQWNQKNKEINIITIY